MVYIHVPFCKSFCTYCGFYSVICRRGNSEFEQYAALVCKEAEQRREEILASLKTNTIYIGGGTPSVLPAYVLERIIKSLPFDAALCKEFTVECNPDDITPSYVASLKALGVNRISLGVQSFDDTILKWMARRHNADGAVRAIETVRHCGIDNVSIDLIFGFPGLSDEVWAATLEKAVALKPEHISAYQLSIEEGSALEKMLAEGRFSESGQEQCSRQYDYLCKRLGEAGYRHYEVSNFAKPCREALHNSAYWSGAPYVGLGPGAHSFDGHSRRSWNSELAEEGYTLNYEELTPEDIRIERLMLGLRTAEGLSESEIQHLAAREPLEAAIKAGLLVESKKCKNNLRIPEERFFVSDDIIRSLI